MGGLARPEYRRYDSAGITLETSESVRVIRAVGKFLNLADALEAADPAPTIAAIGHTRWATHGRLTAQNMCPHSTSDHRFSLVHNGIIENADSLCAKLASQGAHFSSDMDTKVVVHLLQRASDPEDPEPWEGPVEGLKGEELQATRRFVVAMRRVTEDLEGTFTLLALCADAPGAIVAARRSSPLAVGLGQDESFPDSDVLTFIEHISRVLEIDQNQQALVIAKGVMIIGRDVSVMPHKEFEIDFASDRATKGDWATFMEKEIHEQPQGVADTLADRLDSRGHFALDEVRTPKHALCGVDKIVMIGCDTTSCARQVARYTIEHWCRIPVEVELSSEFRYHDPVVTEKTLVVAISQSGETMDMIQATRHAREQGVKIVIIINTPGSTISRESDAVLLTHAGSEIAVTSTKALTSQATACYILGPYLVQVRRNKYAEEIADYMDKLFEAPARIQEVLDWGEAVREFACAMANMTSVIYPGCHAGSPVVLEGALKLKEIYYIYAEGFATGEPKHGPIVLVDEGQPATIIVPTPCRPGLHNKVLANIQEVRARGARMIVTAEERDTSVDAFVEVVFCVPSIPTLYAPLFTVVSLQIFACELAIAKGLDVDQPRNLAKSATVEQAPSDVGGLPIPMWGSRFAFGGRERSRLRQRARPRGTEASDGGGARGVRWGGTARGTIFTPWPASSSHSAPR